MSSFLFKVFPRAAPFALLFAGWSKLSAEEKPKSGLRTVPLCHPSLLKEEEVLTFEIDDAIKPLKLLTIRSNNKVYCLTAECPYEEGSLLADAVCIGNKLCCLDHGCSFNIESGNVETGPAQLGLAIFPTKVSEQEVSVMIPADPPRFIRPSLAKRDLNCFRKVVIIGGGMGAFGCIKGLRLLGYDGQIALINKDRAIPCQKDKTFRQLDTQPIVTRDELVQEYGVTFLPMRNIEQIMNKHGSPYIVSEDLTKMQYDALVLANGITSANKFEGHFKDGYLSSYFGRKGQQVLSKVLSDSSVKKLLIVGLTPQSAELMSTIHKNRKDIKILCLESSKVSKLQTAVGKQLMRKLVDDLRRQGADFILGAVQNMLDSDQSGQFKMFTNAGSISADAVLLMDEFKGVASLFEEANKKLKLQFNDLNKKLQVDINCRAGHKRIFGVGTGCEVRSFLSGRQCPIEGDVACEESGFTAACNIMAMNIPFHLIPFRFFEMAGGRLFTVGSSSFTQRNEEFVSGSLQENKFIRIDYSEGKFRTAQATRSHARELRFVYEAARIGLFEDLYRLKFGVLNFEQLEQVVRKSRKVGCYKDEILQLADMPRLQDVIWLSRNEKNAGRLVKKNADAQIVEQQKHL